MCGCLLRASRLHHAHEPAAVFTAACALADARKPVTRLNIISQLRRSDALAGSNIEEVIADLASSVPSTAVALYYAAQVKEKSVIRQIIGLCSTIQGNAFNGNDNAAAILDALQHGATKIADSSFAEAGKLAGEVLPKVLDDIHGFKDQDASELTTGFPEVDARIRGLIRKHLVTIAGAGKIGKTSFALNIVGHVGLTLNQPLAFLSHEMTSAELVERLLISTTGVPLDRLRADSLSDVERARYDQVQSAIQSSRIVIDDSVGATIQATRQRLRQYQRQYKIRLAILDYYQLLGGSDPARPSV